jgi:hypothetical protein
MAIDGLPSEDVKRVIPRQSTIGPKSTMTIHPSNPHATTRRSAVVDRQSADRQSAVGTRQ